jgi:hypothetical protein
MKLITEAKLGSTILDTGQTDPKAQHLGQGLASHEDPYCDVSVRIPNWVHNGMMDLKYNLIYTKVGQPHNFYHFPVVGLAS